MKQVTHFNLKYHKCSSAARLAAYKEKKKKKL